MTRVKSSRQKRKRRVPSAQARRSVSVSPGKGKKGSLLARTGLPLAPSERAVPGAAHRRAGRAREKAHH
eukprot:7887791-Pyramimonas_sp.AAC.1